jgi:hypothetical protein
MEHDYPHLNTLSPLDNARKITSWLLLHATVTLTVVLVASKKGNGSVTVLGALLPYNLVQYGSDHGADRKLGLRTAGTWE